MLEEQVLTAENWQDAAVEAIGELPEDISASVGWSIQNESLIVVTVAVEPVASDDDEEERESDQLRILIRHWGKLRDLGWPAEHDSLYAEGGPCAFQADLSVVHVHYPEGVGDGMESSLFLDKAEALLLQGHIQIAILETMHSGGADSLICKDEDGRFVRDDGSLVLEWQTSDVSLDDDDDDDDSDELSDWDEE